MSFNVSVVLFHSCLLGSCLTPTHSNTRIGVVVFALHDPADVFLNAAKISKYFNLSRLCDSLFVVFVLSWVFTRLSLFPVVINTCIQQLKLRVWEQTVLPGDCSEILLLCMLMVLHVYWSVLIARMAYKAVIVREVEKDIRSDDE